MDINQDNNNYTKEVMDKPPEISISSLDNDASSLNERALGLPQTGIEEYEVNEIPEFIEEEEEDEKCKIPVIEETEHYLKRRRINDFMQFMMNHLLVNEPDDPVKYLCQLVDKCLLFRSGVLSTPPVLFEDRHITSLYSSFDPLGMESISIKQYCTDNQICDCYSDDRKIGMSTLGLKSKEFDRNPETLEDGTIAKNTFIRNAKMALVEKLLDMIMLPPPYSDGETSSIETFLH